MPNIGPLEIGIVLVIALVIFGPKRVPELGRSMGKGIREFKGSLSGAGDQDEDGAERERPSRGLAPGETASGASESAAP